MASAFFERDSFWDCERDVSGLRGTASSMGETPKRRGLLGRTHRLPGEGSHRARRAWAPYRVLGRLPGSPHRVSRSGCQMDCTTAAAAETPFTTSHYGRYADVSPGTVRHKRLNAIEQERRNSSSCSENALGRSHSTSIVPMTAPESPSTGKIASEPVVANAVR